MPVEKSLPTVSAVIPMRDEERYIPKCIDSLVNQDYPDDLFEILVIDGSSADNSKKIARSYSSEHPNILFFENPDRFTSYGLNIGIKKSKGDIIIILGAHSFVKNDFIRKNVEFLRKMEEIDCVGGPIISLGETPSAMAISSAMSSPFGVGGALFRYAERESYVDTVAFGGYRREVFKQIGLFDEEMIKDQDDEFNYRLRKAGGRIFITPAIRSFYYNRATLRKLWSQYFHYGLWKIRVFQKHRGVMKLRQFVPGVFLLSIILGTGFVFYYPNLSFLLLSVLISYFSCNFFFSVKIAKGKGWKYLPLLPLVFAILHFSYGAGFLTGLVKFIPKWFQKEKDPPRL